MIGSGGGVSRNDDRGVPVGPQLAVRVGIVGTVALLLFGVIFLRLWFLQVLTGSSYVAQAQGNIVRNVPEPAPRGSILAADGSTLVQSIKVPAVQIQPQELPVPLQVTDPASLEHQPAADDVVYDELAHVLGMSTRPAPCRFSLTYQQKHTLKLVSGHYVAPLAEIPCIVAQNAPDITIGSITIATNIPVAEQAYISERENLDVHGVQPFRGVQVSQVSVSQYPQGQLAAQVLGTVGANADTNTGKPLFDHIPLYDKVGQGGLEYEYNRYLQGHDGAQRVKVDAQGSFQGETTPLAPGAGYNLRTSIDLGLQRVGQAALARSITDAGTQDGGAFVAMNPQNGQIYGLGSLPSFDPQVFTHPLSQAAYDREFGTGSGDPLLNRAIQSVGPTGSTFKVVTATAALESGAFGVNQTYDDATGKFCLGQQCSYNSGHEIGGVLDIPTAFEMSDDVFFYNLGALTNVRNPATEPDGAALQTWARRMGIGQTPHIDVPYAASGTLPTPAWVANRIQQEIDCDRATGPYAYTDGHGGISPTPRPGYHRSPRHAPGGCGITAWPPNYWTIGDNTNMAVGQGDVQASPLQLAMIYAAIANGGTLVTPHIGADVETATGAVVQRIDPGPERRLNIEPTYLQTIQSGLRLAASGPRGTSTDVMGDLKVPVYGKTGTAQYTGSQDYSWYACFVPASATSKPIVVVVWVEKGGFGDVSAAPVARQILSQWFFHQPGPYRAGVSTTL